METGNQATVRDIAQVVEYDDLNVVESRDDTPSQLLDRNPGPEGDFEFLLGREWVLTRTMWPSSAARGLELIHIYPFQHVGQKPQVAAVRDLHYMFNMDLEVSVEIVSTFNMAGCLIVNSCHADWEVDTNWPVETRSLIPHRFMFASDQPVARFQQPFQSPYDYASCAYRAPIPEVYDPWLDWASQWSIVATVCHPLSTQDSTGQQCEIVVRAKIVKHKFVLPHVEADEEVEEFIRDRTQKVQSEDPKQKRDARRGKGDETKEAEKTAEEGVVSGWFNATARFSKFVGELVGYKSVGDAIAGAATLLGQGAKWLGFQKPNHVSDVQLVSFNSTMDHRVGQSRGIADAFTFNLGSENDQSVEEGLYGYGVQTNDFVEYACIPAIVEYMEFNSSTAQGTLLGEVPIYPHLWTGNIWQPARVACAFVDAYCGDLQHMFVVSSSKFVTSKIAIQIGTHASGTPTLNSIGDTYTEIITLNGSGIHRFRTPFLSFRRVIDKTVSMVGKEIHVHAFLLSQSIQVLGDDPQGMKTRIDWECAFAPNARFFVPSAKPNMADNVRPVAWGYGRQDPLVADKWQVQCDPREEFRKVFPGFVGSKMLVYEDGLFPDEVRHWNDIRMRPMKLPNYTWASMTSTGPVQGSTVVPTNPQWMYPYARWRCTMRYTVGKWEGEGHPILDDMWPITRYSGVANREINYMVVAGTTDYNRHFVSEVPRWRTTNYDSRLKVDTGIESFPTGSRGAPVLVQAGDSTVGFVPTGLYVQT